MASMTELAPMIRASLYLTSDAHSDPALSSARTGLALDRGWSVGDVVTWRNGSVSPPGKRRAGCTAHETWGAPSTCKVFSIDSSLA